MDMSAEAHYVVQEEAAKPGAGGYPAEKQQLPLAPGASPVSPSSGASPDASPAAASSRSVSNPPTAQQQAAGVRGEVPLKWDLVHEAYSEWLMQAAVRQREVARYGLPPPNLEKIIALHSGKDSSDPCEIEPFKFEHPGKDASIIKELEAKALAECEEDQKQAIKMREAIDVLIKQAHALDVPGVDDVLRRERDAELTRCQQASQRLAEIFSRDAAVRRGRQEILLGECGPAKVEAMSEAQKNDLYKDIRDKRVVDRLQSSLASAKALCDLSLVDARVVQSLEVKDQIKAQESKLEYFKARVMAAGVVKSEVDGIVGKLEESLATGRGQLDSCRSKKADVRRDADAKREELAIALETLRRLEGEYMDLHVQDEALRISADVLEQDVMTTTHRLEMAQLAASAASEAIGKWDTVAKETIPALRGHIEAEADACQERSLEPAKTAALNVSLAMELLQRGMAEKHTEMSDIQRREDENAARKKELEARMKSDDDDVDFIELETELARRSDETKAHMKELDACKATMAELEEQLATARRKHTALATNKYFGEVVDKQDSRGQAQKTVANAYVEHQIFTKVRPRFFFAPGEQAAPGGEEKKGFVPFEWVDAPELKTVHATPPAADAPAPAASS